MKTRSGEHAGAGPGSGLPGKNAMRWLPRATRDLPWRS